MSIKETTEFKYKTKKYNLSREDIIDKLTWPFKYKHKLKSNSFIINIAFNRNIWEENHRRFELDRITRKYGFIFSAEVPSDKNFKLISRLSDRELMLFFKEIVDIASSKNKKTGASSVWVFQKGCEAYFNNEIKSGAPKKIKWTFDIDSKIGEEILKCLKNDLKDAAYVLIHLDTGIKNLIVQLLVERGVEIKTDQLSNMAYLTNKLYSLDEFKYFKASQPMMLRLSEFRNNHSLAHNIKLETTEEIKFICENIIHIGKMLNQKRR